jgi:hypothetical protein
MRKKNTDDCMYVYMYDDDDDDDHDDDDDDHDDHDHDDVCQTTCCFHDSHIVSQPSIMVYHAIQYGILHVMLL